MGKLILESGSKTMGRFLDTNVVVKAVTDTVVKLEIAGSTVEQSKEELRQMMAGEVDPLPYVIYNVASSLALAGVEIQDDVAIKREVERRAFKMCR